MQLSYEKIERAKTGLLANPHKFVVMSLTDSENAQHVVGRIFSRFKSHLENVMDILIDHQNRGTSPPYLCAGTVGPYPIYGNRPEYVMNAIPFSSNILNPESIPDDALANRLLLQLRSKLLELNLVPSTCGIERVI